MNKKFFSLALVGLLISCAHLDPGADPLVVRTEQAERMASSTFDLLLKLDDSNRAFYSEKVPEFHSIAEWLREPQPYQLTNYPRAITMVLDVNDLKRIYKQDHSISNNLLLSLTILEQALIKANGYTNLLHK